MLDYEEKYKFIDIGKLHEKVQFLQTKLEMRDNAYKGLEQELFDLRERILRATTQRFMQSTGKLGLDGEGLGVLPAKNEKGNWQGETEVEETA